MKILITGASGFLGGHLLRRLESANQGEMSIYACGRNTLPIPQSPHTHCFQMDLSNKIEVEVFIQRHSPDIIVNCAANTKVGDCENNSALAYADNVLSVENLLLTTQNKSVYFLQISTDMVFDGNKPGGMYAEDDITTPVNTYGLTKLQAEQLVSRLENSQRTCIFRTSLIYGNPIGNRTCFLQWMVNSLRSKATLNLFTNEYRCPVYVKDFVDAIILATHKQPTGLFNVAGRDRINRVQMGQAVSEAYNLSDSSILQCLSTSEILPCRPLDVSLDIRKAQTMLNYQPCKFLDGLKANLSAEEL